MERTARTRDHNLTTGVSLDLLNRRRGGGTAWPVCSQRCGRFSQASRPVTVADGVSGSTCTGPAGWAGCAGEAPGRCGGRRGEFFHRPRRRPASRRCGRLAVPPEHHTESCGLAAIIEADHAAAVRETDLPRAAPARPAGRHLRVRRSPAAAPHAGSARGNDLGGRERDRGVRWVWSDNQVAQRQVPGRMGCRTSPPPRPGASLPPRRSYCMRRSEIDPFAA